MEKLSRTCSEAAKVSDGKTIANELQIYIFWSWTKKFSTSKALRNLNLNRFNMKFSLIADNKNNS